MSSTRRDLVCAAVLFIVAVVWYIAAVRLGSTALSDNVGPGGLPRVYGAALAIIAIGIAISSIFRARISTDADKPAKEHVQTGRRLTRAGGTIVIGAIYLASAPLIGYPFAIAALLAAMSVYQGTKPSWQLLAVAASGGAVLYVLFELLLGVTLPAPWNG